LGKGIGERDPVLFTNTVSLIEIFSVRKGTHPSLQIERTDTKEVVTKSSSSLREPIGRGPTKTFSFRKERRVREKGETDRKRGETTADHVYRTRALLKK